MKILLCHNYYQHRGGEDESFDDEAALLKAYGHDVLQYTLHNDDIERMGWLETARRTLWNDQVYDELRGLIHRERPAVMHCTNTFPLLSAAALHAAWDEKTPVVQALRNYRLFCLNSFFLRNGAVCESCLGKTLPWPGVLHGCYRDSRAASAVVAAMFHVRRSMKTWTRTVSLFFTLTEFSRQKFIQGGLPAERIVVKPNFVLPDPGPSDGAGRGAVFVGRLSVEKGIDTLLAAWSRLGADVPLTIIGDGPLAETVQRAARQDPRITWLGRKPRDEVLAVLGGAACLIMPSVWYETFGRTIMEAFAKGTPVIASRLGAMEEVVEDGQTGMHFTPGDPDDLAAKVRRLWDDSAQRSAMRSAARLEYEAKYTAQRNYELLMAIYARAIAAANSTPLSEQPIKV
jgi:glycosyltransferase involved in cell wall biosynthesis